VVRFCSPIIPFHLLLTFRRLAFGLLGALMVAVVGIYEIDETKKFNCASIYV
jgi:hypothetical protein